MEFKLNQGLSILERTPEVLKTLLADLDDDWIFNNEGGDSWSPFDVLGHLIHGEKTDWVTRAKSILNQQKAPFERFDRFAQFEDSKGKTLQELLETFGHLRQGNIQTIKALQIQEHQLNLKGLHPALGEVTLGQLLATWTVHDLSHINQITRVMARNYSSQIGPWRQYINLVNK